MTAQQPAPVSVTEWNELRLRGQKPLRGALRVLVAGQAAGGAERSGESWSASWMDARACWRCTDHATAEEAVTAVIASGWARKLGARKVSHVFWSPAATRMAHR